MSNPPPSGDPTGPYDPPPDDPPTPSAGLGQPPPGGYPQMDYPPTAAYPQYQYAPPPPAGAPYPGGPPPYQPDPYQPDPYQPDPYQPGPYQPDPYQPGGPPPRRSNVPLIAVILASTLLLCGGAVVAGVLLVRTAVDSAKEAIPDRPTLPTALPTLPTDLPTDLPDLPGLPTDLPGLPPGGTGRTVEVGYEVDGDGPADITYLTKTGEAPTVVRNAKLPWRFTVSMSGISLASVVAVRTGTSAGSIRCRTTVDGTQVAERSGEGLFAVASCSKLIYD